MLSPRSLIGFSLSVLIHGGIATYILTHDFNKEAVKQEKISMRLDMFKVAPPSQVPSKPTLQKKEINKQLVKSKELNPIEKPIPVIKQPKPEPITESKKETVEPVINKVALIVPKSAEKPKANPIIKKKTKSKKKQTLKPNKKIVTKKVTIKKKVVTKKLVTPKPRLVQKKNVYSKAHQQQRSRLLAQKRAQAHAKAQVIAQAKQKSKAAVLRKPQVATKPSHQPTSSTNIQLERQYGQGIRQQIERGKNYPRRAKRMHKQGIVKVGFTINRNGLITNLRIVKSSGTKILDRSALLAVNKVGRFPPFPAGINKQSISYTIPILFSLR